MNKHELGIQSPEIINYVPLIFWDKTDSFRDADLYYHIIINVNEWDKKFVFSFKT